MTQTLTTERLKDLKIHRSKLIFPASHEEVAAMVVELLRYREAAETPSCWEIAGQLFTTKEEALKPGYRGTPEPLYDGPVLEANREAQPVGYIDPDSLKEYRGQRAGGTWSAVQRTTSGLNMTVPIYLTAPPAPSNAQPVAWLAIYHGEVYDEAISITRSVVEAQADRFGWESALTEIIPLYRHAPPAPAVTGDLLEAMAEVIRISDRDHEAWDRAKAAITACSAAMLAQPVSQGKLPDLNLIAGAIWSIRAEEEDRLDMEIEDLDVDHSVFREAAAVLAMLAAPEGGNEK